jgi:hypothetical protein
MGFSSILRKDEKASVFQDTPIAFPGASIYKEGNRKYKLR